MRISTLLGAGIITLVGVARLGGALIAPHASGEQFRDFLFAPPMRVHLRDTGGDWHAPFVYPLRLVDRVERRYEEDRTRRVPLVWFSEGKLVRARDETMGPLLLLGADSLGRDVFSRLVVGARTSLGVAFVAALGALVLGALVGGLAGYAGGVLDEVLMRVADFVLVVPAIYLVLALRAVMPLVLAPVAVFALIAGLLAVVGSPWGARDRRVRAPARLRRRGRLARRRPRPVVVSPPAAGHNRLSPGSGHAAAAGVHHGGGHPVVCRARVRRTHAELGIDVARGGERAGDRRLSLAACPGCRDRDGRAVGQSHR